MTKQGTTRCGWHTRRGFVRCRRLAPDGYHTCGIHRTYEETAAALADMARRGAN